MQQGARITTSRPVSRSPFPLQKQRNSSSAQVSPPFGTDQVFYQKYNDRESVVEMRALYMRRRVDVAVEVDLGDLEKGSK